ncbi:MAG: endonuclease/exonuclease/phosphatase family protein [Rhodospirillaceae bacterium]|nr:endonuclease/exonuclease/phosphatase family protein [Rhodospirillaceae bacterium]
MFLNIRHGGGARIGQIHATIKAHRPDIIVLTEFRENPPGSCLRDTLSTDGLIFQATSLPPPKKNGVLIAARAPFKRCDEADDVPPDRHRWITVQFADFGVTGTYFPSLHEKVPHLDYMLRRAAQLSGRRHLFTGDFNTGKNRIDEAGTVFHYGHYFDHMAEAGWHEAWRRLHPTGRQYSWYSHKRNGFRIDHAFLSPRLQPALRTARYSHGCRKDGTSDHSALIVELNL